MATINFYLKSADKNGFHPIILVYQKNGQKFKHSTRLKVKKANWLEEQKIFLGRGKEREAAELNSILDDLSNILSEIEREAIFKKKDYPIETIHEKFKQRMGELKKGTDFFSVFDRFIESSRSTKIKGTVLTYVACKNRLLQYQEDHNISISFDSMTPGFYNGFLKYLIEEKKLLNNTVGKHIKILKVFLNYATVNGIIERPDVSSFKVFKEDADVIYLTESQLMHIYHLKGLPTYLEHVKDNFCFGCFTGLRFSDIEKIRSAHIKAGYIEIRAEKTKDFLKIPISDYAQELLDKYNTKFNPRPLPPCISNQKTNEYLKVIGEKAGLLELVEVEKFNGSKKIKIKKEKFQFLSTHTARRTFVTLSLEKGLRPEVVMSITGHKDYRTFQKYIKITDKVKSIELNRVWSKSKLIAV